MASTSFTLGKAFDDYLTAQVETGRYASKSEIVREALRRMEDYEAALETVRDMVTSARKASPVGRLDRKALENIRDEVLSESIADVAE
jgi:antitoxin ParD1/3/4